jgi:hypothetical protein
MATYNPHLLMKIPTQRSDQCEMLLPSYTVEMGKLH